MAQIPSLDSAAINLSAVREHAQKALVQVLETIPGKKAMVLDLKISGPLALITHISLLKEHGVENLHHLSNDPVKTDCRNVVYLVRPEVKLMKFIASQVLKEAGKNYTVVFVPRRTIVCEKVLEDEGVLRNVTISEYPLYLIPYEEDVLSLELDFAFKEIKVDGDLSALWHVARAVDMLQSQFGLIPNVKGKGRAAAQVMDILSRMRREQNLDEASTGTRPEIDTMILLDRQADLITPMVWQLTYEGLIDEFLSIKDGAVELAATVMNSQAPSSEEGPVKTVKVPLNSTDKLYRELRDKNFGGVGPLLRTRATAMRQDYSDMTGGGPSQQSVSDLRDFVKKLNVLPELTRHINIAQHLSTFTQKSAFLARLQKEHTLIESQYFDLCFEYVEEMIQRQESLESALRLLVLLSLTSGGLPKKQFDYLRREFLHSYGFEHMFTLSNLEKAGLLKRQEQKSSWQTIKRLFRLVIEDMDDTNPTDISYVYSGYAPLSVRLVQQALKGGWKSMDDVMKMLPGPTFEQTQGKAPNAPPFAENGSKDGPSLPEREPADGRRAVVLVVFIGGVTFAEIAALRFLSLQDGMKYDFIIATTKLINGSSLLKTMMENVQLPRAS